MNIMVKRGGEMPKEKEPFKLSEHYLSTIIDSLDQTGGFLVKESELRYWIERIVNEDRERRFRW